ncbi:tetratricopeptide (TPR) repeat protein [Allocatelliglobosispora scoriae]|uniref:Tetratricopeptide (TPR) repeat protein n=1 Tax=Allocatelliglobosispora scoriae TaxID=643052 RepID=A0A841BHH3_9ACTN|nr:tetratricopeptide repeat protein [Allocatelliglobosispora scoriae]MBB5866629.1 tetratricopeptide (TPR) repeat protein [Allocatelliglobosispora scoriae]
MHAEVIGDLLNRHAGITVLRDPHDIVTELTGVGLGHSDILPACPQGKPSRMSPIGAADPEYLDSGPRAVFHGSYQRLSARDARILRYLSLHPGRTHTVATTAMLAGTDPSEARSALRRLKAAHLIDVGPIHGTWSLHDLLRLYAREVAANDDSDSDRKAALHRLFAHYFTHLEEVNFWINGRQNPDQPSRSLNSTAEALAWAQTEAANAVACASAAVDMDVLPQAWDIAIELNPYLDTSGDHATALAMSRLAVDIATAQGDPEKRASALNNVGHGLNKAGLHADAKAVFLDARSVFHRIGDKAGEARVLTGLSEAMRGEGDADATIPFLRRAVRLYREIGAADDIGYALTNLGTSLRDTRSYTEASRIFDLALKAHRAAGARRPEAQTLALMATVIADDGDTDRALTCLNAALNIARELHDTQLQGMTIMNLGTIHLRQGGHREAERLFLDAIALFRDIGDDRHAADTYINLVVLNRHLGRNTQATLYAAELDKLGTAATEARQRWSRQRAT